MSLYTIGRIAKTRARAQSAASLETKEATVLRTYSNGIRVTACDVLIKGQQKALIQVPNVSTNNWGVNDTVIVNLVRGNSNRPQISGAAGATTANSAAGVLSAATNAAYVPTITPSQQLAGVPFLLEAASSIATGGYVANPGSNVYFQYTPPSPSSGGTQDGTWTINAKRLKLTSLPSAVTTTLPDGTLADLVDSYGNQLGMYRLDLSLTAWVREDVGGGGSGAVNSGTAGQIAYYAANGTTLSGETVSGDATLSAGGVLSLKNTGPGAGTYGNSTNFAVPMLDNQGRVAGITTYPVAGGNVPFPTWSNATAYSTGNIVYGSDGNLYRALGSTTGNDPTVDTGTNWCLYGLLANLTLNCGVGQRFADTFAASSSPGGAMTPGVSAAITYAAPAGVVASPTVAALTFQQANNPSTTCSGAGTTTTVQTTVNVPINSHLLFKGDVTAGLKGAVTTVTGSSYSGGTYTLTVSPSLSNAPATNDTFWYTPFYGTNRIVFNQLSTGGNAKILGSTSNPVCPTILPSVTFGGTGGSGWAIGPPNYFAVTYTYADSSGTTRETLPGPVVSQNASSGQQPTIAPFTLPAGIAGANLYASQTLNGTLYKQAAFTISGGVAQALTVASYTTASGTAPTSPPDPATYPCSIGGNPAAGSGVIQIQPQGQSFSYNTVGSIQGLQIYGLGSSQNASVCGIMMSFNEATKVLNCVITGFGQSSGSGPGGNAIISQYGNAAVYLSNVEISNSYTGLCLFAGAGLTRNIRIYNCEYGILADSAGSRGDVEGANVWCTGYGFFARYSSTLYTTPYQPTNGTAQPTYGSATASSPGFNSFGSGQSAGSIVYND